MKDIFSKLLTIKSLVTLCLTAVFCYLAADGQVGPDLFLTVYTVIIAFYFGTQYERGKASNSTETNENQEGE